MLSFANCCFPFVIFTLLLLWIAVAGCWSVLPCWLQHLCCRTPPSITHGSSLKRPPEGSSYHSIKGNLRYYLDYFYLYLTAYFIIYCLQFWLISHLHLADPSIAVLESRSLIQFTRRIAFMHEGAMFKSAFIIIGRHYLWYASTSFWDPPWGWWHLAPFRSHVFVSLTILFVQILGSTVPLSKLSSFIIKALKILIETLKNNSLIKLYFLLLWYKHVD